jgi:predicted phosphodiesterase
MSLKHKLKIAVLFGFLSGITTAMLLNCDRDQTEEPSGPTDPGPDPEDPKDPSDPPGPDPEDPSDPEDPKDPGDPKPGPGETFRFCLTGDTGEGNSDQKAVAAALLADNCQAMLIAGDVIYSSGIKSSTDSQLTSKFFKPYEAILERMPIYLTLGNHDYRGSTQPWLEVSEKDPRVVYPNMWYQAQVAKDICLFGLDSNASQKVQLDWILEQIPKVKAACKFSIAAMHHPYRSSGHHASEEPGKNKDLYEKAVLGHFDLAFSGHEHHLEDALEIQETTMLIAGGGGTDLREVNPKYGWAESAHGYLRIDIKGSVGSYTFRIVEGNSVKDAHSGTIQGKGLR